MDREEKALKPWGHEREREAVASALKKMTDAVVGGGTRWATVAMMI